MVNRQATNKEILGTLLLHRGGMYAYIKEIKSDGYIAYYSGGTSTWVHIPFNEVGEWTVLREGY